MDDLTDEMREKVAQFVAVTGAVEDFAHSFLLASSWNLEEAINSYLAATGAVPSPPQHAPAFQGLNNEMGSGPPPAPAPATQNANQDDGAINARVVEIMQQQGLDELTARAIAEVEFSDRRTNEVRAPIAAQTSRLIDNHAQSRFMRDFDEISLRRRMLGRDPNSMGNALHVDLTEDDVVTTNPLGQMFQPPRELLFSGMWEECRETAKRKNLPILVNIQRESEFLSYILNRDLWSNEIVKELISKSFVFFQRTDVLADRWISIYRPSVFPHVSIIDPFTGEELRVIDLSKFQADPTDLVNEFLTVANTFLESHVSEGEKIRQMQERMQRRHMDLGASIDVHPKPIVEQPEPVAQAEVDESEQEDLSSAQQEIEFHPLPDEPEEGPDTYRVRFRLFADRKIFTRRFLKTDKVEALFRFAMEQNEESRQRAFDLVLFPRISLLSEKEKTLEEMNLKNASLTAAFL